MIKIRAIKNIGPEIEPVTAMVSIRPGLQPNNDQRCFNDVLGDIESASSLGNIDVVERYGRIVVDQGTLVRNTPLSHRAPIRRADRPIYLPNERWEGIR